MTSCFMKTQDYHNYRTKKIYPIDEIHSYITSSVSVFAEKVLGWYLTYYL